mgnify:CR=1 FL=1
MNAEPLVEARGLSKYFPIRGGLFRRVVAELKAVDEVSFEIPAGKMGAIVGPTGEGKSTLINLIPRLYDPAKGTIRIDGKDNCTSATRMITTSVRPPT